MAVAAHVGKVSKDYSPYGYSIMEEVTLFVTFVGTKLAGPLWVAGLFPSDSDIFIEEASVAVAARTWDAARFVDCTLVAADNGGSVLNQKDLSSGGALNLETGSATKWLGLSVDQNRVVSKGRVLFIKFSNDGGAVDAADSIDLTVSIRYRRKA
tara:strand:+ start:99 stop:560 length:462 start_codon:yes stop_codon:yes gene_type:complete